MRVEASEYGALMAREILRDSRVYGGTCEGCGDYHDNLYEAGGALLCAFDLVGNIRNDERKGGHLSEWLWLDSAHIPAPSTRYYRTVISALFTTLETEGK